MRASLAAFVALILAAATFAHERPASKHTYNQHVRPIFEKHCAQCHIPGGIAPMSLMTYGDASPWSAAIRTQVLERTMPPWQPEEGVGDFRGSRYLSAQDIEAIVDWATGGTPEGDVIPAFAKPAPRSDWRLGKPDMVFEPAADVVVPADVMEQSECIKLQTPSRPVQIGAFEFRPGNAEMVHGAAVVLGSDCSAAEATPIAMWTPGEEPFVLPPGFMYPAGSFHLKIHYRKTWRHDGKELKDRTQVGVHYTTSTRPVRHVRLDRTEFLASAPMRVLSILPAPRRDGLPIRVEFDGKRVLQIDRFDPAWQTKYVLKEPLVVRKVNVSNPSVWLEYVAP